VAGEDAGRREALRGGLQRLRRHDHVMAGQPVACLVPPEDLARLEEQETPGFSYTPAAPGTSPQPVLPGPMPIAAQHQPGPLRG